MLKGNLSAQDIALIREYAPQYAGEIGPMFEEANWDEDFEMDMYTGKGFIVKEKPFAKAKKVNEERNQKKNVRIRCMDGTHSPRFGTTFEDENAFAERYSCNCGRLIGRVYEGEICKHCGTPVKFVDVDLSIFAWYVILHGYTIIQPAMYKKLEAFIGKSYLNDIIEFKFEMDLNGYYEKPPAAMTNKNPFYGIGMLDFKKRFVEIMQYFLRKKKIKKDLYNDIMANRQKVFASHIPIYSAILRPVFISEEDYSYTNIDKKYNSIYGNINNLNKNPNITVASISAINTNLYVAQTKLNKLYKLIFTIVNQKKGHIRENILGGRINFSARNVIIPDASLRAYQIRLPYLTFLELYKLEILNLLVKMQGVNFTIATNQLEAAKKEFSPKIYEIMNYMIKNTKHGITVNINRNPRTVDASGAHDIA